MKTKLKRKKGFTLIELMIVVSILSVLALMLLPNFIRGILEAQMANCAENERTLASAIELYRNDDTASNSFPANLDILVTNGYLPKKLTCLSDPTGSNYNYTVNQAAQAYTIQCVGNHTQMGLPLTYPHYYAGAGLVTKP